MALVCTIELSKTNGVTITVENADASITQTFKLDGTAITTTVKGSDKTSTITQDKETVKIVCTNFTVEAETISCKSTKNTTHTADQKFDVKAAQDVTIKSDQKITATATGDAALKGMNAELHGNTDAKVTGMNVKLDGTAQFAASAPQAKMAGSAQFEVSGAIGKVSSTAQLTCEGTAMLSLKGAIVQLQGSPLVKIG